MGSDIDLLKKAFERERKRRKKSEKLLEDKTRELYLANQNLQEQYNLLKDEKIKFEILASVSYIAERNISTTNILSKYVGILCKSLGFSVGHVYVIEDTKKGVVFAPKNIWYLNERDRYKRFLELTNKTYFNFGDGVPGNVINLEILNVDDDVFSEFNDPRGRCAKEEGFINAVFSPIIRHGEIIAVAEFFSIIPLENKEPMILEYIEIATKQLGIILERRLYDRNLEDSYSILNKLYEELKDKNNK